MDREIKFRGQPIGKGGKWMVGIGAYKTDTDEHLVLNAKGDSVEVVRLCQYTGFKGKNGKKIFEGDILEYIGKRKDNMNKVYHRKVVFHEGAFFLSVEDGVHYPVRTPIYEHNIENWDVVGNVTDTPELMK